MINFFDTNKNNLPKQVKINTNEIAELKKSVKITPKGEYDAETEYKRFDLVIASDNNTYICNADVGVEIVGQDPTTSQYWTLYAMHGAQGEPGQNGADGQDGADGENGTSYLWYGVDATISTTLGQTTTVNKSDIIETVGQTDVKNGDMIISSNAMTGFVVGTTETTITVMSFVSIKGAQGEPGQDAPTYTAGSGIQISQQGEISSNRMENPMTSAGDLIYGGPSGTPTALPIGQPGQIPAVNQSGTGYEFVNQAGGGGQLYQHNIYLYRTFGNIKYKVTLIIICGQSTAFANANAINTYFVNNGYDRVPCNAIAYYAVDNAGKMGIGLYLAKASDNVFRVAFNGLSINLAANPATLSEISESFNLPDLSGMYDTVVAL